MATIKERSRFDSCRKTTFPPWRQRKTTMFTLPVALMVHSTSVTPETSSGELLFTMQGMGEDTHDLVDRSCLSLSGHIAIESKRYEQSASSNPYHMNGKEN